MANIPFLQKIIKTQLFYLQNKINNTYLHSGHCKTYRDTGSKVSHQIGVVIGLRVRDRIRALRFMDRLRI